MNAYHEAGLEALGDPTRREIFELRVERFWADLRDAVAIVHPDPDVAAALSEQLVLLAASAYVASRSITATVPPNAGWAARK